MKSVFKILFLFLLIPQVLWGSDASPQELFDQANQAYLNKDFSKAVDLYAELEKKGISSPDLFYNLANTYYRMGQIGFALYYDLKALRLTPRDPDLLANYRYLLSKRSDKIEPVGFAKFYRHFSFWTAMTTLTESLLVAASLYLLFFFLLFLRWKKKSTALSGALLIVAMLSALVLPSTFAKFSEEYIQTPAVLTAPAASVYSEPSAESIKLFELHEGALLQVAEHQGSFSKIILPDGKRGWMEQGSLREIH